MNFKTKTIIPMIMIIGILGCTSRSPCLTPCQTRIAICADLKRQLIFYNNDPNHYAGNWDSPTRQAMLLKRYRQYDCENVLRENCCHVCTE